jgi:hypothetical protein
MVLMAQQRFSTLKRCKSPPENSWSSFTGFRHNKYPEIPVAVSEIASISRNRQEVFAFTAQVANWMDQCPWVFEYSFFGCMRECADSFVSPEAQLMNPDGTLKYLMNKIMNEQPIRP